MLTKSKTRIISAFPGTGKSYYCKNNPETCLDSDSSNFSWIVENGEKIRNPDFPRNYIEHIKENVGKYDFIFVSSHEEVRRALEDNCFFFFLVYPKRGLKNEYLDRYKNRRDPDQFVNLIDKNWDVWISGLRGFDCDYQDQVYRFILNEGEYIEDMISILFEI